MGSADVSRIKTLIQKMWKDGVPPADYEKEITLIIGLTETERPAVNIAPSQPKNRGRKRQALPLVPTLKKAEENGPSKTDQARAFLTGAKRTAEEVKEAVGGTSNVYVLLGRVGAVQVGQDDKGRQLYTIEAPKTGKGK